MKRMTVALLALSVALAPVAAAVPAPVSPSDPAVAQQWVNPAIRAGEGTKARISLLDAPSAINAHELFHVKLRVENSSDEPLQALSITPRRGPATGSPLDQRVAHVAQVREYSTVGRSVDVEKKLAPGESTEVELALSTGPEGELPLPGIASYPVLFELRSGEKTLDTERFHLSVRGVSGEEGRPGLSALYPISAAVDIVPGETGEAPEAPELLLESEQLAAQLAPGGRLDQLVEKYAAAITAPEVGYATCAALDPALLDTVARMEHGYRVTTTRPPVVEEPKRLRDSWTSEDDTANFTAGTGAADAAAWLEKVRAIAATGCVVALPWANADLNAVARTGNTWLMREAIERGPFSIEKILGVPVTHNVVIPPAGYITADSAPALGWADHLNSAVPDSGMQGEWELAQAATREKDAAPEAALERAELPAATNVAPQPPRAPVQVLVAASSVETPEPSGRFAWVAPGVMAVKFQDSLAATLAAVGPAPATAGVSNPALRFDATRDSQRARAINAAAAVRIAVQDARSSAEADVGTEAGTEAGIEAAPEPVLVSPPATWDADSAAVLLGTIADLVTYGEALPLSLGDFLTTAPEGAPEGAITPATRVDTPFTDPTVYSDAEILNVAQQAAFTDDLSGLLVSDPQVTLTRYGFTLPLRRDLLAALTLGRRRSLHDYDDAVDATANRLRGSRDTLHALRASVTLIPPGNVYTRTSPTSPLLIVAQNGMPLPVEAKIHYRSTDDVTLHTPASMRIPARGSVTVQMTADIPQEQHSTDVQLYLAASNGSPISQPVDITVRTAGLAVEGRVIVGVLVGLLALLLLFSIGKRRAARANSPPGDKR